MPKERQTNVNINYVVNTVDVQKSNDILNRASASTDNLRKQTQTFGREAATSYKFASTSIGFMQQEVERLKQKIQLTSVSNVAEIKKLSDQYKSAKSQLDAYNKSLLTVTKSTKDTAKSSQELADGFGQVFTVAKLFVAFELGKKIVGIALDLAKLSGNVEGVEKAFNRTFPNSVQLLNDLKTATHGTVTGFELMQRTLQATNLGVAVEQLPILFEFAAARAQQTGESVDYLVDSIVRGIGRKSILVLDNLGLSATRLREQFNGAALASLSVGEVTKGVAEIAKVELEKMGGFAETSATKVDHLTASIQELKIAFSKKIDSSGLIDFFQNTIDGFTEFIKGEKEVASEEAKNRAAREIDRVIQSEEFKSAKDNQLIKIDLLFQELINRKSIIKTRERELQLAKEQREQTAKGLVGAVPAVFNAAINPINDNIKSLEFSKKVAEEGILVIKKYLVEINKSVNDSSESLGIIEALEEKIKNLHEAIKSTKDVGDLGLSGNLIKQLKKAEDELSRLLGRDKENRKKQANEIQEYLSYLSDLELFETKNLLKDKQDQRTKDAEIEKKNAKNSFDVWKYFNDLKRTKQKEADDEANALAEDAARKRINREKEIANLSEQLLRNTLELALLHRTEDTEHISKYYDEQIKLAGNNDKEKKRLEDKRDKELSAAQARQKEQDKRNAKSRILIDGLLAIAKIFSEFGWPAGIVPAAIMAGITATNAAQVGKFAKGGLIKGPGSETSDSIPILASRNEFMVNADSSKKSPALLKAVNSGKLNDKVLKEITSGKSGGSQIPVFDDSNIVNELRDLKNNQVDYVEKSGMLFKVMHKSKDYKQRIRAKSMG